MALAAMVGPSLTACRSSSEPDAPADPSSPRERGFLADRGFVAFYVDYRAHAGSDGSVRRAEREGQLGYVADVVNAALALRESTQVDVIANGSA